MSMTNKKVSPGMHAKLMNLSMEERQKLSDGKLQWTPHCGNRERLRHLRRLEQDARKQMKDQYGIDLDLAGRTPMGIVVPGAAQMKLK